MSKDRLGQEGNGDERGGEVIDFPLVCQICGERGQHLHSIAEVADAGLVPCFICGEAVTESEFAGCDTCSHLGE